MKKITRKKLPFGTFQYCVDLNMIQKYVLQSTKQNYYILVRGRPLKLNSITSQKRARQMIQQKLRYSAYSSFRNKNENIIFQVEEFMDGLNTMCIGKTRFVGNALKNIQNMAKIYFTDYQDVVTLGFMFGESILNIKQFIIEHGKTFETKIPITQTNVRWFIELDNTEIFFDSYIKASQTAIKNNVDLFQTIH